MSPIRVNRFKSYRVTRWYRSAYLWSGLNPYLKKYNIEVTSDSNQPCDVLAIPCPHIPGHETPIHRDDWLGIRQTHRGLLDYQDTPMICDSSMDYAYLDPAMRELLHHPQLRYYLTGVQFRDPQIYQRGSWGGEYHGQVYKRRELYNAGPDPRIEREPLPAEVQAKIRPISRPATPPFPDAVYEYIAQKIRPLAERPVDLFFSGRTMYTARRERCYPTAMRQQLLSLWGKLPGKVKVFRDYHNYAGTKKFGRPIKDATFKYPFEYVDRLLESKVVISPWGWSPWCIRDLEALACGCVVIKPECSGMLIYPDIYDPTEQYMVWCDLMYDYLPQQLEYIYRHLDEMQVRADRGRQFVLDAMYPVDKVYARWTKEIRQLLERCLERPAYTRTCLIPPTPRY
jgi:hypothetical protein